MLARRINRADGSFAGTVHVSVAITYFLQRFSALDLGRQGNSGLWTRNTLIARYSEADPDGANSGKGTPSPQLRALLDSDQLNAGYRASSGIDGVSRVYRFHRIAPHELFLVVGLADEEILAEWKGNAAIILGLVLLFSISSLVFARQMVVVGELLKDLPPEDRVTPIVGMLQGVVEKGGDLRVEVADTNESKELMKFCRKLTVPLRSALREVKVLAAYETTKRPVVHVFFIAPGCCYTGYSYSTNNSPFYMGIPRLKFPSDAPSRSTLKLEEAFHVFIPADEWDER